MDPVLECVDLSVTYPSGRAAVRGVSFQVRPGECLALVGASGAGKSTIAKALIGLHRKGTVVSGALRLNGTEMNPADPKAWRAARGRQVGFVAQNPWAACDPLRPVRDHVAEAWRCHGLTTSWQEIATRLDRLGVAEAHARMAQNPHTWSGGMLQRASIAAATALDPALIIADEPTSALDADRAQAVLDALRAVGRAMLLISHDVGLVMRNADRIGVVHGGQLVDTGTPENLRQTPGHRETQRLLAALSPLPRRAAAPNAEPLLRLSGVTAHYAKGRVRAVDNANLEIAHGEIVGLHGPSGSGKSTLLRLVMGLEKPHAGQIIRAPTLCQPAAIIPVFQDPTSSLVPHWPIWRSVAEPLTAPHVPRMRRSFLMATAVDALASVGLEQIDPEARPNELSVGQCQRVAIARASVARPALIAADEPTSALDSPSTFLVSVLLRKLAEAGTAVLIVSHNRGLLERLADRILFMCDGRIGDPFAPSDARVA